MKIAELVQTYQDAVKATREATAKEQAAGAAIWEAMNGKPGWDERKRFRGGSLLIRKGEYSSLKDVGVEEYMDLDKDREDAVATY